MVRSSNGRKDNRKHFSVQFQIPVQFNLFKKPLRILQSDRFYLACDIYIRTFYSKRLELWNTLRSSQLYTNRLFNRNNLGVIDNSVRFPAK